MGDLIWSIVAAVGGFGVVGFVFYYWLAEHDDREQEEHARAFFDEHGLWPDEAASGLVERSGAGLRRD